MEENQEITEEIRQESQAPSQQAVPEQTAPEEDPREDRETAPEPRQEELFTAHIRDLEAQGESLRQSFPDFDLARELSNPVFLQLTAPGTGIGVEDAYYALHHREIREQQARDTARKVVQSIQSGSRRPLEAGTTSQGPSLTTFQYGNATREQREAFKKELRRAWGRGETVYPR